MIMSVTNGINTRFGLPWTDNTVRPAPNVINYPNDWWIAADPSLILGNASWDNSGYWKRHHFDEFGNVIPRPDVLGGASRYQVYLFEQGIPFWKKNGGGIGKNTRLVSMESANGWSLVDPADYPAEAVLPANPTYTDENDNEWDGEPPFGQTVSSIDYERRVLRVAVMDCLAYEITGADTYPAQGQFLAIFLIRQSDDVFEGGGIYGEIIGAVEPRLSLEFHGNVRLVE
jgi:hypothetical protein